MKTKFPFFKQRFGEREFFWILVLSFALAHCLNAQAQNTFVDLIKRAEDTKLWENPSWLRQVHYKKNLFNGHTSEADGPNFFLGPNGKTDPHAELLSSIEELFPNSEVSKSDPIDNDARCRFPGRKKYLAEALGIKDAFDSYARCPKLKEFMNVTRARSVTVVFSSYYLANPSSAFGHSLLRLNRYPVPNDGKIESPKILDLGVNYAAVIDTVNPIYYVLGGMLGSFRGVFGTTPYYLKVREYADFESRDLWEYDLNLTEDQTQSLVWHLWELDSTYFDYYFLFENCSYHTLTVLDAAVPSLNLQDRVPFYVIPIDTIKALYEVPGLVHEVQFRPSLRSQFEGRKLRVKESHQNWILRIQNDPAVADGAEFQNLDAPTRVLILDAAIEYYESKNQKAIQNRAEPEVLKHRSQLLFKRSRESGESDQTAFQPDKNSEPHAGHESFRWGLGYFGNSTIQHRMNAEIRFALHDTLDRPRGYAPFSSLEFFNLKSSFTRKKFYLDDFRAVQAESFIPYTAYHHDKSYSVKVGLRDYSETRICKNCMGTYFDGAWGFAFSPWKPLAFYTLATADILIGPRTRGLGIFNFGIGPRLGAIFSSQWLSLRADAGLKWRPRVPSPWVLNHTLGVRSHWSNSLSLELEQSSLEASDPRFKITLYHYF